MGFLNLKKDFVNC